MLLKIISYVTYMFNSYNILGCDMFCINDAYYIANKLGIDFSKYTAEEFLTGINIELEHGLVDPKTNVTNDDLEKTAKIALAHLNEHSNYYDPNYGLLKFEEYLSYRENN